MQNTSPKQTFPYILGLDLGIASIGWAITETESTASLQPIRLRATGVRVFQAGQVGKKREAPNLARRTARTLRRRLRRKKLRQKATLQLLIKHLGIRPESIISTSNPDIWNLRVRALDQKLSNEDLAKVIYHIIKHRGFKSSRKDNVDDNNKDSTDYKAAIEKNKELTQKYRSFAEMLVTESGNPDSPHYGKKRNTTGVYIATPLRSLLEDELKTIFESQRKLGNTKLTPEFLAQLVNLLNQQKSFASRESILEKVGRCTLLPEFKRASRHTPIFQEFQMWQTLSNTRLIDIDNRVERPLAQEEKILIAELLQQKESITYNQARKIISIPKNTQFKGLRYDSQGTAAKSKNPESATFVSNKMYHLLSKAISQSNENYWVATSQDSHLLDAIATELTICPTSEELTQQLKHMQIPDEVIDSITAIPSCTGFVHLSLDALRRLIPHMRKGMSFDEACTAEKLEPHSQLMDSILPEIDQSEIRNPVVLRTVTQTRKVLKAIINTYGPPCRVHIEMSRDLSRSPEKRSEIERQQRKNQENNQNDKAFLQSEFGVTDATGTQLRKYRLWKEQNDQCAYSGKPITRDMLFDDNQTQIDHALPFSRTLDDSYYNKVLVLVSENQAKADKSPYEYLQGDADSAEWQNFERRVESWNILYQKKLKLMRKDLPKSIRQDEMYFCERDINDTRYIAKFIRQYLENYMPFSGKQKRKVIVFSGPITSFFRLHWGLSKDRDANNRHHAVDAAVLCQINTGMLTTVATWAKEYESRHDKKTRPRFPEPWTHFHHDLKYRILEDRLEDFWDKPDLAERYKDVKDEIKPLFVSRAARRKATGKLHEDTFYSSSQLNENKLSIKKQLAEPEFKTLKNGITTLAGVTKKVEKAGAYTLINRGLSQVAAANGSMIRIDIFEKEGKFYICPVYTKDVYANQLPMKVIKSGKDEKDWTPIDDSFSFLFSLWPSDYVQLEKKNGDTIKGYYLKTDRRNAAIDLRYHDDSKNIEGNGIMSLKSIKKIVVDPLGNTSVVTSEPRQSLTLQTNKRKKSNGLANGHNSKPCPPQNS